jgi:6,7-dimethyl-8-ribityllumazine synthase
MKYLIVAAEFNAMITDAMLEECLRGFKEQDIEPTVLRVPGAAEIPVAILKAHSKEKYDAVVAIGSLVKGETDHYKAICEMVTQGLTRLMLDHQLPIIFEVLMTDTYKKAEERIEKGYHAAFVATRMAEL